MFDLSDFGGMVYELRGRARTRLNWLLFDHKAPKIPWEKLVDNHKNAAKYFNFAQDARNNRDGRNGRSIRMKHWGYDWLRSQISQSTKTSAKIDKDDFADIYIKKVDEFKIWLLLLTHIIGGPPATNTEILNLRHTNDVHGQHRNVFIEDGLVMFDVNYHKQYNHHASTKDIPRYLPREAGELVVWYLWLVLPFHEALTVQVRKIKYKRETHKWESWGTEHMEMFFKQVSTEHLGCGLNISLYRQIVATISLNVLGTNNAFKSSDSENDAEEEFDTGLHTGDATPVNEREYRKLKMEMQTYKEHKRRASTARHRFLFPDLSDV